MTDPSQGSLVRARGLRLSYDHRVVLEESDFDIPRGAISSLIGPNGSGKTTLLNAIAGLLTPVGGTLEVHVREPRRRHVAYVLQATGVNEAMPVTVAEVVGMGRYALLGAYRRFGREDRRICEQMMEHLEIDRLSSARLDEISAGERQRVFVAQGLVQEAELILLDEPVTGLDLVSRETILRVIEEERDRGTSIILTTHDLEEASSADHVLVLASRVVAEGGPAQVLNAEALSEAYGVRMVELEGGVILDDPHHRAVSGRHVHFDRTGHSDHGPD